MNHFNINLRKNRQDFHLKSLLISATKSNPIEEKRQAPAYKIF